MSGLLRCPRCNAGPFSYKGLSIHKRSCNVGTSLQLTENTFLTQSLASPSIADHVANPVASLPGESSFGQSIFDRLTGEWPSPDVAVGRLDRGTNSPVNEPLDEFPCHEMDDELSSSELNPVTLPNIMEGDQIGLPPVISAALFKPPDGFSSSSLYESVNKDNGIRFRGNTWQTMTPREKSNLHLLKVLKGKDLSLFKAIQDWRRDSEIVYGDKVSPRQEAPSRKAAMDCLQKAYGYENLLPKKIDLVLPRTKVKVQLIVFPFGNMLLSLLTDPVAMQAENLNIDPKNPFAPPKVGGEDGHYGDFNTGTVHKDAHARYCTEASDILAELTLFIDKTHLDNKGKHTLEPVMFTTGLFKRKFRNQHEAWRPLGFIPNLDLLAPHADVDDKQMDYHFCLRIILSELAAHQKLGGIKWTLAFGTDEVPCRLQIPVNCILGDTDGHDKLCARRVNRTGTVQGCLCRYCDVSFANLGNPRHNQNVKLTKCTKIRQWRNNPTPENVENLKMLGYKPFHDGAVDLCFSDPVRGLHGCTPGELLHAFQLGLAERSIESCFGSKKLSKKTQASNKRKRREETMPSFEGDEEEDTEKEDAVEEEEDTASENEDSLFLDAFEGEDDIVPKAKGQEVAGVMKAVTTEVLSTHFVFNKKAKARVDELAKKLHRFLKWQSDKSLPRTSFPQGITKLTKMQGNERTGILLVLLIILVMEHWSYWRIPRRNPNAPVAVKAGENGYIECALSSERFNNTVKSIYLLLTFEALMKCERIPVALTKKIESFIPDFLDQVLRTFARQEGVGDNLVKNHLPSHFIQDIRRLGAGPNFDSGVGESLHKTAAKETGRRTNMNSATFEFQTGIRYVENLSIHRGCCDHPKFTASVSQVQATMPTSQDTVASCRMLTIGLDALWDSTNKKRTSLPLWEDSHCRPEVVIDFVRNCLIPQLPNTDSVCVYTKVVVDGVSYSCNPCYGSLGYAKQDWAFVNMGSGSPIPCQLLLSIEVPVDPVNNVVLSGSLIDEAGTYFLAHACQTHLTETGVPSYDTERGDNWNEGTLAHADQKLVHRLPKSAELESGEWVPATAQNEATIILIDSKSIVGPCVAIPDLLCENSQNEFFVLRSASDWHELFLREAKDHYKNPERNRRI